MIARRILAAVAVAAVVYRAAGRRPTVAGLDDDTREYDLVELRQVHGRTASELAAEKRRREEAEAWEWSRIEAHLSCDADFRTIANRWNAEFPDQT
jgi:hypothetical protein